MTETITVIVLAVVAFGASAFGVWYIYRGDGENEIENDSTDTEE